MSQVACQLLHTPIVMIGDRGPLSPREAEATQLVGDGLTAIESASVMGISPRTANCHVEHAMDKLGAVNRANLIQRAFALRILITVGGQVLQLCAWWVFTVALSWALYATTVQPPDDLRPTRRPTTRVVRVIKKPNNNKDLLLT